ncbi:MbnH family di-heme enzyme [Ottowia sp.]|uniref:MbnH family di-heme enzyme n=1 Tax=Ottowia sp. TaxID=1898956 RepID=UPI003A899CD1
MNLQITRAISKRQHTGRGVLCAGLSLWLASCGGGSGGETTNPIKPEVTPWQWTLPTGWSPPVVPTDNPMSQSKVQLGRQLFYEPRLSGNGALACSGCHDQSSAFTDNRALSRGATGQVHPRNAQALTNVAYNTSFNWARPDVRTLEAQMQAPLFNTTPVEMGVNDSNRQAVLTRLKNDANYPPLFAQAFPESTDPITWENVIKAIASFERTLISASSRYDLALAGQATLTDTEERGRQLFFGSRALCAQCHGSPNFNNQFVDSTSNGITLTFHNTGLFNIGGTGAYPAPNRGVFEVTELTQDMGRFRAPSLRNVALTAPYMHDGSIGSLQEVLATYAAGGRNVGNGLYAGDGRANPFKDPLISAIELSAQDQLDLAAFLQTLTDDTFVSNPDWAAPGAP